MIDDVIKGNQGANSSGDMSSRLRVAKSMPELMSYALHSRPSDFAKWFEGEPETEYQVCIPVRS